VLESGELALDLLDLGLLLRLAHRLVFLRSRAGSGCGRSDGTRVLDVGVDGRIPADESEELVKHVVGQLVNVQLDLVLLDALAQQR
jgi:hypothetical protein